MGILWVVYNVTGGQGLFKRMDIWSLIRSTTIMQVELIEHAHSTKDYLQFHLQYTEQ